MKRFFILITLIVSNCLSVLTLSGQVSKFFDLTVAGTLKYCDFYPHLANDVTNLTISGKINASDIRFMRDEMNMLAVLDLSGVNIVHYSGSEGTLYGKQDIYLDHNIPISSFENKESLTSIILPKTATSIDLFAFSGCKNLTMALISHSPLDFIGDSAFAGCISLGDTLSFPSTITSIGTAAFSGCENLSVLYFPSSLTLIRQRAFESCTALRQITNMRYEPILLNDNVFSGVNQATCDLHVPESSICLYQNSPVWKEFSFERTCYSVSVINNKPAYGFILGEGFYEADSIVTLTAIPHSDCEFLNWSITKYQIQGNDTNQWEEVISYDSSFSFIITQDTTFTVHFDGNEIDIKEIYFEKDFISIYPNPTNNHLHIETKSHLREITIYDISGKIIKQWDNTISPIDISDFPSGIYFMKLSMDKNITIRKVIKH
jgi:hypothetical protein